MSHHSRRTAIITGGSMGLGRAIVSKFNAAGIKVLIADIFSVDSSQNLFFKCDIRKGEEVDALYKYAMETIGVPDILILNAGIGIKEKLTEGDPEKWQKVMDTNVMGALRCVRAFVPQMMQKENSHVVFISSVAANQPHPYGGIYSASKTALAIIAETLRMETLSKLKVTSIYPGAIATNFFDNQLAGGSEVDERFTLMDPDEVAEDVLYVVNKSGKGQVNQIVTRPIGQEF